jgi:LPXTG-site transpeptidase (sortase) family protein
MVIIDNTGYLQQFTSLVITFDSDANDSGGGAGIDDVTNALNYLLLQPGPNATLDTTSCFAFSNNAGSPLDDDIRIPTGPVVYDNAQGAGPFTATVTVNNGTPLPVGRYYLLVCGTTSITDLAGNHLNGGEDTLLSFRIVSPVLPETGFAPGMISILGSQPAEKAYAQLTGLWLEVPKLGMKMNIVGVPLLTDGWDVSWLGSRAGWLMGSAFPTWSGNSVITAHVWNADNAPGPFVDINKLSYGDRIIIHAYGQEYVYEVRSVLRISLNAFNMVFRHEELSWLTLLTCRGYSEATGTYHYRLIVRAVQVEIR